MSGPDVSGMAMTVLSVRNGPNIGCTAARMVLTVRNASDKAVLLPGMVLTQAPATSTCTDAGYTATRNGVWTS